MNAAPIWLLHNRSTNMKLLIFFQLFLACYCSNDSADYYVDLIETEVEKARFYTFADDASEYKPKDTEERQDAGTYDFIIVGTGITGSVLAGRLSEISNWTILAIDAGDFSNDYTSIPGMAADYWFTDYNWQLQSTPQTTACLGMRWLSCPYLRGRGVGGGSIVNALFYVRGPPEDYNAWADEAGEGWSWDEVLPYFKKTEDFHKTDPDAVVDPEFHSTGGPLSVEFPMPVNNQTKGFYEANQEESYQQIDCNGDNMLGVSPVQLFSKKGVRQDAGTVFVKPVLDRTNLNILTRSYATKINIDETKTARSVEFSRNKQKWVATATKEIILSAGTFGSAQLLMLSGVGPKDHLEDVGIDVVQDLEVGSVYHDHILYPGLTFSSNFTLPVETLKEQVEDWLNGTGILAVAQSTSAFGFYHTSVEEVPNYPDIEILFSYANVSSRSGRLFPFSLGALIPTFIGANPANIMSMFINLLRTKSSGTIRLKCDDPYVFPEIDANFLTDEDDHDINALVEAIQLVTKFSETEAFEKLAIRKNFIKFPQCLLYPSESAEYWRCALRILAQPTFHPVSSCRMGKDPENGAVVDNELRVYGINNLRVADASIFPFTFAAHPSAPCMMVGEKLSDLLKDEYSE